MPDLGHNIGTLGALKETCFSNNAHADFPLGSYKQNNCGTRCLLSLTAKNIYILLFKYCIRWPQRLEGDSHYLRSNSTGASSVYTEALGSNYTSLCAHRLFLAQSCDDALNISGIKKVYPSWSYYHSSRSLSRQVYPSVSRAISPGMNPPIKDQPLTK